MLGDVVEKRAEGSTGDLGRGIRDDLNNAFELQLRSHRLTHAIQRLERVSLVPSCALRLSSRGDVMGNFGCANDHTVTISDRRNGQRNLQALSVFVLADRLVPLDALARAQLREDLAFLVLKFLWDQFEDRLANHLFRRPAEQSLGSGVP